MAENYVKLDSEHYWQQSLKQQIRAQRRLRSRKAVGDFSTFLLGLFAIAVVLVAVANQDHWMPMLQGYMSSIDLATAVEKIASVPIFDKLASAF